MSNRLDSRVPDNDRYEVLSRATAFTRSAYRGGVSEQQSPDAHRTTTVEDGRFCSARCSCGWRGPARRARSKARADADAHSTAP
ncbi:hypothetical protein GCM10018785_28230 [Streptomyces longispororuber]|uniref:Uncharacterized protein n=1 Tax=Streptomyces longispororuber TaxID=68230 RepID=A0A918ZM83_9ACTN|nr:hypothetical protein GCM10018785_28230 [Streptomyces longispororuber]